MMRDGLPYLLTSQDRQTLSYFKALKESRLDLLSFEVNWEKLETTHMDGWDLSTILDIATQKTLFNPDPAQAADLHDYLIGNKKINLWLDAAKRNIDTFSAFDVSKTIKVFPKFGVIPDTDFLQQLKDRAIKVMGTANPHDISQTCYGFAALGVYPGDDYMNAARRRIFKILPDFRNIQLGTTIWAITIFSAMDNSREMSDLMEGLLLRTKKCEPDNILNAQIDMAALWFGQHAYRQHSIVHQENASGWEHLLRDAFMDKELKALAEMEAAIPELWRKADFRFTHQDRDIIVEADGPKHFVRALDDGKLRYDGSTIYYNAVMKWLYPDTSVIRLRYMDSDFLGEHAIADSLKEFFNTVAPGIYETAIDNAQSLALDPVRDVIRLADKAPQTAPKAEAEIEPQSETTENIDFLTLKRERTLGYFDSLTHVETGQDFTKIFLYHWRNLASFTLDADELMMVLKRTANAFTSDDTPVRNLKNLSRDGIFGNWFNKSYRLGEFSPDFLCSTLTDFSNIGIYPPDEFMEEWHSQANDKIHSFNSEQLAQTIRSFARFGVIPPKDFMNDWVAEAGRKIHTFSQEDFSGIVRAMAVFYAISNDLQYRQVGTIFLGEIDNEPLSQMALSRINQARILFDLPIEKENFLEERDNHRSNWELHLLEEIQDKNLSLRDNADHFIPALNRMVDIRLDYKGRDIILEADGPTHFIKREQDGTFFYGGSSILQAALLQKVEPGATIIRLRYMDNDGYHEIHKGISKTPPPIMDGLMPLFDKAGPGVYETRMKDGNFEAHSMLAYGPAKEIIKAHEPSWPESWPSKWHRPASVPANTLPKSELLGSSMMKVSMSIDFNQPPPEPSLKETLRNRTMGGCACHRKFSARCPG